MILSPKHPLNYIYYFIVLCIIQFFVLDKVNVLYGYIVPYIYFYILLWIPINFPKIWLLFVGLLVGIFIDSTHFSAGIHSFACVNVAFFRNTIYLALVGERKDTVSSMSIRQLGAIRYISYLFILTTIHAVSLGVLEWFSISIFQYTFIVKIISDIIVSLLLIILVDLFTFQFRKTTS